MKKISDRTSAWTSGWLGGLSIVGICLACYLPGLLALPPVDRDEVRFAEATRGMLAADTWRGRVLPMFDGKPRLNKPPLIYWLQMPFAAWLVDDPTQPGPTSRPACSSELVCGPDLPDGRIGAYRLPSVIAATAAALMTWRLGVAMFPAPVGWLAGILLGCCPVVVFDAHQARTDQTLLAMTVLAQLCLWKVWTRCESDQGRPGFGWLALFWTAVGLGVMTKGPITPAVCAMTALALSALARRWGWLWRLRPVAGAVWVCVLVLPWYVTICTQIGWAEFTAYIMKETVGRSVVTFEGHWGPPGYHLAFLPILFWPGSLALVPAALSAWRRGLRRPGPDDRRLPWHRRLMKLRAGRRAETFCIAWLVPTWLVFELLATKLPHYTLPAYPAVALLCARGLFAFRGGWRRVFASRVGRGAVVGWWIIGPVIGAAAPIGLLVLGQTWTRTEVFAAAVVLILASSALLIAAADLLRRRRPARALALSGAVAVVTSWSLFQFALPHATPLWVSNRLVAELNAIDPDGRRALADSGFHADSLVFLTHGRVERIHPLAWQSWIQQHPTGLLIADRPLTGPGPKMAELASVKGFDYTKGRWIEARILERATLTAQGGASGWAVGMSSGLP